MGKKLRIFLIVLAAVCFAIALYAPVSRFFENRSLDDEMDELRRMKQRAAEESADEPAEMETGPVLPPDTGVPAVEMPETDQSPRGGTQAALPSAEAKTALPSDASVDRAADAGRISPVPDASAARQSDKEQTPVVYTSPTLITDQSLISVAPFAAATAAPTGTARVSGAQEMPSPAGKPPIGEIAPVGTAPPTGGRTTPPPAPTVQAAGAAAATPDLRAATDQSLYQQNLPEGEARGTPPAPSAGSFAGAVPTAKLLPVLPGVSPAPTPTPAPGLTPAAPGFTAAAPELTLAIPEFASATPESTPSPTPAPTPSPTPFVFVEANILPEYRELYEQNADLVGWLKIDGTLIDYPVLKSDDEEYYMTRDFFGRKNYNGQLILDANCDPFTPSVNLVISGHNMKSGKMFGRLQYYASSDYARKHPIIEFDTLFRQGEYRLVAAFYTWDYEAREGGFQYNVNIQYRRQMTAFLEKLDEIKLYDTGVSVEFGDELLMLSTCSYQTGDGRFVVVARRLRPGEAA